MNTYLIHMFYSLSEEFLDNLTYQMQIDKEIGTRMHVPHIFYLIPMSDFQNVTHCIFIKVQN